MKAKLRRLTRFVIAALLVGIALWSCTDKPDTIGLELLDSDKSTVGKDTVFELFVYSEREDSVTTDETSVNLLGSMFNETFGRSNTSIYTQVRISSLKPDWGSNPVADSVVFTMVYADYYGDLETEQTVKAYRLLEDLERDSTYWSNVHFDVNEDEPMAEYSFIPNLDDILVVDSGGGIHDSSYIAAELRIPFYTSFADYMFNLDTAYTSSSDAFLEEFKGIYLRNNQVDNVGDGAILSFDLLENRSNLTIFYHNDSADSLKFGFLINLNNARVGRFAHEYELSTNQNFIQQVLNGDQSMGEDGLYLEGTGGVKTIIKFPGVTEWMEEPTRVINQASLIINLAEDYTEDYKPSTSLILFKNTESGSFDFVPDQLEGESYFGGQYSESSNAYVFRISIHLQDLLAGEPDLGLSLFPNAKSIKPTELKLYGTNPTNPSRFQLQVIYTEIK